jgi:hypothetical protein
MAYLIRRPSGACQIRESVRTDSGPRSRTLASFHGPLDDRILDRAARKASRPLDRDALVLRAKAMGIGWQSGAAVAARRLITRLRRGRALDPVLVGLLQSELETQAGSPLSDDLAEAADWVGASDEERAATLRGLLRLGDAIVQSRGVRSPRRGEPYPRIDSRPAGAA